MKIIIEGNSEVIEVKDEIVQELILRTANRANFGYKKYQTTLKDNSIDDFIEHCLQEIDDLYKYMLKIKEDYTLVPKFKTEEFVLWNSRPSINFPGYLDITFCAENTSSIKEIADNLGKSANLKQVPEEKIPDWLITALHPKERLNVNDLLQTNQDDEEYYPDRSI